MVIAGAWNPAVLTPEWIIRYGLEHDPASEAPLRFSAMVPAGIGLVVDMPRYSIEGITFSVRPDSLVFQTAECTQEAFDKLEKVAGNTLRHLTHTPIGGLGYNFDFVDDAPSTDALAAFTNANLSLVDQIPATWSSATSALISSFSREGGVVNIQRVYQEGSLRIKFNFHYNVDNATSCQALLSAAPPQRLMWTDFQLAQTLTNNLNKVST